MIDKTKIDLNAPAFGAGAQKLETLNDTPTASVEEQEPKVAEQEPETSEEESKVSYSRFKNIHSRAKEAEAEASHWKARAEELENRRTSPSQSVDEEIPGYFRKLYLAPDGSNYELVKEAWNVQKQHDDEVLNRAYEAAQRGAEELEYRKNEKINENVSTIEGNFEQLSAFVGRDLTAKEQSAILDIVDDYTAKDEYGNYAGELMPFEKAYEIYELKQNSSKAASRSSRDNVASLSGASSQGNADVQAEQNKSWNPLARGTWRSRLNG